MTDVRDLVGLLQRADWTRLSLSAEVNDGSVVLVLPGKRYRYQTAERLTGCDGGRPWEMSEDDDDRGGSVHWISGPAAPLARLLCPAWLLECSRLELRGRTRVCRRDAFDVVVTRRPSLSDGAVPGDGTHGPIEVVVDAESGILLRVADPDGEPEVTELVRADFAPVIEAARFQPPPGSLIAEGLGESIVAALGPVARVGATAAGLAAGALGAWIRYSPLRRAEPATPDGVDIESSIAADEPPPDRGPDGPLVSDELLGLLYAGGPTGFAATHAPVDGHRGDGSVCASVSPPGRPGRPRPAHGRRQARSPPPRTRFRRSDSPGPAGIRSTMPTMRGGNLRRSPAMGSAPGWFTPTRSRPDRQSRHPAISATSPTHPGYCDAPCPAAPR